jgi:molybdenum cofactor cytidylyltransferase
MKCVLILLAAGLSRRFGPENKLLHLVEGKPLYRHTLDKLEKLQDEETRLLVMTNTPEIQRDCDARGICWGASPQAEDGIAHTIRAALALGNGADAYVFFVADQPKLKEQTIRRFLAQCRAQKAGLACLASGDVPGNPAWFDRAYLPELQALQGDVGGRRILLRHKDEIFYCPAETEELEDIDLPS